VALESLLMAQPSKMILDDIPSFKLVFRLSFFVENYLVTYLSVSLMELFDLGTLFAFHFVLFCGVFNLLMLQICYEIY
jgi:hypothetical protein